MFFGAGLTYNLIMGIAAILKFLHGFPLSNNIMSTAKSKALTSKKKGKFLSYD